MCMPEYLYHATTKINAEKILGENGSGLMPFSTGEKSVEKAYLCMSSDENGATTRNREASDIVIRVKREHLAFADWRRQGAGQNEWRSDKPVSKNAMEYRRFLGNPIQRTWRAGSAYPLGMNGKTK